MAPHARLPLVGECLGGLSVGTGYQSLASVRPGRTCNKTHRRGDYLTSGSECKDSRKWEYYDVDGMGWDRTTPS